MWNFDDWFELYWRRLPKELFSNKDKGSKQQAKTAAKSKVKSAKKAKQVDDCTEAWIRFKKFKMDRKEFTPPFQQVVRVFRYERYFDEIPSYSETEKPEREIKGKMHPSHEMRKPLTQPKADPNKARLHLETIKGMIK